MRSKEPVKRKLESSKPNNLMSKIKKKELQKIQLRRRKLESARVTWQTNNPWYDSGIKKRISKGWPSKKNQSLMKKKM
jgi:hypothetical protein